MNDDLLFLRKLVSFDTNSITRSQYAQCAGAISRYAEDLGLQTEEVDGASASVDGDPRPNLVISHEVGASETIIFATHYDTVPAGNGWKTDPFHLTIAGDKAYGRGAADDKSGIIACLSALHELKKSGASKLNVKLVVACDEEVSGSSGLGYVLEHGGLGADYAIIVDGSPELTVGASGVVSGVMSIRGKQGHAGYPHLSKNAIYSSLPFLGDMARFARIREKKKSVFNAEKGAPHEKVWGRFNITMLHSGERENVIPGELQAHFDLRLLPEESFETAKSELFKFFKEKKIANQVDADIKITNYRNGYYTEQDSILIKNFKRVFDREPVASLGANDGVFFAENKIPVISFGAERADCRIHGANEFVHLDDLELVKHTLYNLCANWEKNV